MYLHMQVIKLYLYKDSLLFNCTIYIPLYTQRWYVDGTVECFTGGHAALAVFAILVLAVCVIVIVMVAVIAVGRHKVYS